MPDNNGGPAFPAPSTIYVDSFDPSQNETVYKKTHGMSLRDYFAAKAMQGFCVEPRTFRNLRDAQDVAILVAEFSYRVADAMLLERTKSPDGHARAVELAKGATHA